MTSPSEELFDVVDEDDNVVGQATRRQCHERHLLHRSVMFFILDQAGRVLVNRRSSNKEFYGGLQSIVLGGHLGAGESYDVAVVREVKEEASVESKPIRVGGFKKRNEAESENVAVYAFRTDGKVKLLAEEIVSGEFLTLCEAEEKIKKGGFIPETQQLLPILRDFLRAH